MDFPIEICVSLTIFLLLLINTQAVEPHWVTFSISTTAKISDSAQFFCNATTTREQFTAFFRRNGRNPVGIILPIKAIYQSPNTAFFGSLNKYYYRYTISSLSCSDRGNYSCVVITDDARAKFSNSVTLDVHGPAGKPNLIVPSDYHVLGDNVTVLCDSNVGKPAQDLHLCVGNCFNKNLMCATQIQLVEEVEECIFRRKAGLTFLVTNETYIASCMVGTSSLISEEKWKIGYIFDGHHKPS